MRLSKRCYQKVSNSLPQFVDYYSRTKCLAEKAVLAANGRLLAEDAVNKLEVVEGERKLRTCALRCPGIYGEGEQRNLPRIVVSDDSHPNTYIHHSCNIL